VAYRVPLDALRERFLQLVALRDEIDRAIDSLPSLGRAAADRLEELWEQRRCINVELADVASRIDLCTAPVEPSKPEIEPVAPGSFGRDVLVALIVAGAVGLGVAVLTDGPAPEHRAAGPGGCRLGEL
jgi:hypothetical protein